MRKLIVVAKNKHVLDQVALYWLHETLLDIEKDSSSTSTLLSLWKTKTVYYTCFHKKNLLIEDHFEGILPHDYKAHMEYIFNLTALHRY